MAMVFDKVGVVGAGAWGTALACTAMRAGRDVSLWARSGDVARTIADRRENPDYLPGVRLDPSLAVVTDLADFGSADAVLLVVPAQHLRAICAKIAAHWPQGAPAVICSKGIETRTGALMTEVAAECLPPGTPIACLSGPTFAVEVARGLPTAVTLACGNAAVGEALVAALGTRTFRPYLSPDLIGAEVGGAVKNVMAIACGLVEGRGLGDNARAALITRGLAEIARLGAAKGGMPETFMGLSGMGDLILTATSMQSRNFSLGYALGQGRALPDILAERKAVTEGVDTVAAVVALAERLDVDMPICRSINAILHRGASLDDVIGDLLARPFRAELEHSGRLG